MPGYSSLLPPAARLVLFVESYGYNFQLVDTSGNSLLMGIGFHSLAACVQVVVNLQKNLFSPACFRRFPAPGACHYFVATDRNGKVQASSAMYFSEEECEYALVQVRRELRNAQLDEY